MTPALEVVWNGAHGNQDADLLCCVGIAEKITPQPAPVQQESVSCELVAVQLEGQTLTTPELVQRTGLSEFGVRRALHYLRDQGRLETTTLQRSMAGFRSRAIVGYRLRGHDA